MTYVVYADEGHGFARPENNLDFYGRVEEFLARHLRGRAEPWVKIEGSTAQVVQGVPAAVNAVTAASRRYRPPAGLGHAFVIRALDPVEPGNARSR